MQIYSVPGKLEVTWNEEVKATIDTWMDYHISLEDFREAILNHGLPYAREHGGIAFIVDSSKAVGAFSDEVQEFIDTDIFPSFAAGGIKYFITINSASSSITTMSIRTYQAKTGPNHLHLVEASSLEEAIDWLRDNA